MSYETNTIEIKTLDSITARAPNNVIKAINSASKRSGVDFSYLVQQAAAESSFNPHAKAKTSSATGLYQFIDSTWLSMVDKYGDKYGIDSEGKTKSELLDMRKDPKTASFMAAAFASENEKTLNNKWGGDVGSTELYFAHFMGASGASSFLNARDDNPMQNAADLFPQAALANKNVFYDPKDGKPRSIEEIYQFFDKKFQIGSDKTVSDKTVIADAPIFPQISEEKTIPARNRLALSDNIIMQKAQAMRDATISGRTTNLDYIRMSNAQKIPFFSLIASPIDIMLLNETVKPPA